MAFKAFFRRCKSGEKPGFPRFKKSKNYDSMEHLEVKFHLRNQSLVMIPKIGFVKISCGNQRVSGVQRTLRITRRASGWYGQVVIDEVKSISNLEDCGPVGIDVGLKSFATMSDGSKIENPRFYQKSEKRLRGLQRSLSRKNKGSKNRKKAIKRVARQCELVANQRRCFCHEHSTGLIRRHPLIAVEKLAIRNMVKNRHLSKSISDAGWGTFTSQLKYKAENAGRLVVEVNPAGTSQECPDCGAVKKKELSERVHRCECGCVIDRDVSASRVILARALAAAGVNRLRRDSTSGLSQSEKDQVGPMKQESVDLFAV